MIPYLECRFSHVSNEYKHLQRLFQLRHHISRLEARVPHGSLLGSYCLKVCSTNQTHVLSMELPHHREQLHGFEHPILNRDRLTL